MRRLLLALLLLLALGADARAQDIEEVRDFTALIAIQPDGAVEVTEEITVLALGHSIKRGIYRDLVLRGRDAFGLLTPDFVLHATERDGVAEPSRIESTDDGLRIYLGRPEHFLAPGVYRYRLRYRMAEQVTRHDGFDELYWNVNGTAWSLPTRRVAAEIVLPPGATLLRHAAYTGQAGEQGTDFAASRLSDTTLAVATTRPFAAYENLTISVAFPPGFVAHTDRLGVLRWLVATDPLHLALGVLGIVLAYYTVVWLLIGRDPKPGIVVPVYRPRLPPAAMRFIRTMRFDDQCVAAALLSLAVKGQIVFDEDEARVITVRRVLSPRGAAPPSPGEAVLLTALLGGQRSIALDQENHPTLGAAKRALGEHFEKTFNRVHFNRNGGWVTIGGLLTLAGWLTVSVAAPMQFFTVLYAIWLALLAIPLSPMIRDSLANWRTWRATRRAADAARLGVGSIFPLAIGAALATPFFIGIEELGWDLCLVLTALGLANGGFLKLLRAPTAVGRAALDEIEGTRLYLDVAEAERLRFHNPPERTPAHFEQMLPYAVALGVETGWSRQFADVLARAGSPGGYRPDWFHAANFSDTDLSTLGITLANNYGAAASPPSASGSGSGGGGSSGGGGGGGGGGGW